MKTINIKGKEYVTVNERIKYFREKASLKGYSLTSEILSHIPKRVEFNDLTGKFEILIPSEVCIKATIKDAKGEVLATGIASETEGSTYINKTSYVENCETSAWGRALANLGIGIDASVASADEVVNALKNA